MKKIILIFLILINIIFSAHARSLELLMLVATDGQFLGTFEDKYAPKSIFNTYGLYGSPYSATSIFNNYGNYGSDYSTLSPFNAYSSDGPLIVDREGNKYGRLSINRYATDVTEETFELAIRLKAIRDSE